MFWQTLALSVITVLLLLLMQTRKTGRIKLLLGVLGAVCAAASMVCFLLTQRASGNPDKCRTMTQTLLPCGAYLLLALWGLLTAAFCRKKLRNKGTED